MSAYPGYASPAPAPATYNPVAHDARAINRTPSPTPSEIEALNQKGFFNYRAMFQKDKLLTRKYLSPSLPLPRSARLADPIAVYYAVGLLVIVIGSLFIFYHNQIVHAVQPAANWMHGLPGGWLIPIVIFFIISFPPLFGHEILAIVCGLVWGLWAGFGITAAGTLFGEIGNFYTFRYFLQSRAEKQEKKSIQYACLAKVVREGGFKIAVIVRYSAVPGHFTTAIFAVCGMNIFVFILAALLSMPKQFITVYIGTLLESTANGSASSKNKILSYVVGAITVLVTVVAMWYIRSQVNRVKPEIIHARQKARQAKLTGDVLYQNGGMAGSTDDTVFNPNASDVNLTAPLARSDAPYDTSSYQQWDRDGHAVGYAADPRVFAPQPRRPNTSFDAAFAVPSLSGSAAGARQLRQESTDTARWELQTNAADGQAYPLHSISEPVETFQNPFDNASSETVLPPSGPPPASRSSAGDYAFSAPQHSFQGNSDNQPTRAFSPPPPSYQS
ncbi:hypothetical protein JVT61DRAFT_7353 [Boletus reticuloceps]|uniref:Golgi apparatus membrane protein TVP38 n=1 Tax=Boletus reticuloceps TaxID=495285 RepID=A0A8I2YJ57_9AGAM|nr:hypothetical protein JVT61DRAFT_7353 [Boletus reticuloceps]